MRVTVRLGGYVWRPLTDSEDDTAYVLRIRNTPEAGAVFYTPRITREDHLRFLQVSEQRGDINWLIEKAGERVGACGVFHIDWKNRRAEGGRMAFTFPDAHLLSTVVMMFTIFEVLKLHKMYGEALPSNLVSNRSLERLGLVREGVLRDHVFIDGQPRDVVLYGLLESDWQRIKPGLYARFGEPEATRYSEEDVC